MSRKNAYTCCNIRPNWLGLYFQLIYEVFVYANLHIVFYHWEKWVHATGQKYWKSCKQSLPQREKDNLPTRDIVFYEHYQIGRGLILCKVNGRSSRAWICSEWCSVSVIIYTRKPLEHNCCLTLCCS